MGETWLTSLPLVDLGAGTLVAIIVLMVLLRKLVPDKTYQEKSAEAERWRRAYELEREQGVKRDAQLDSLVDAVESSVELGQTTVDMLRSMRSPREGS